MFGLRKKKNKRILLVEDDAMLVELLDRRLRQANFVVQKVLNGLDVVEKAKKFKPDLILLDLILPGLDGFEVLRNLKDEKDLFSIPVVVLSNLDKEEDVKSTIALGAKEHIVKVGTSLEHIVDVANKYVY